MKTYNPKKITVVLGNHVVTGYAEDSFVNVEQASDGVTMKVGCDGEVVRSISPDRSFNITVALLMYSPTNKFLMDKYYKDIEDGTGTFSIMVKDILGNTVFSSDAGWVSKLPAQGYGKESANREWTIQCGEGLVTQK